MKKKKILNEENGRRKKRRKKEEKNKINVMFQSKILAIGQNGVYFTCVSICDPSSNIGYGKSHFPFQISCFSFFFWDLAFLPLQSTNGKGRQMFLGKRSVYFKTTRIKSARKENQTHKSRVTIMKISLNTISRASVLSK
jgi:hypothetical protein